MKSLRKNGVIKQLYAGYLSAAFCIDSPAFSMSLPMPRRGLQAVKVNMHMASKTVTTRFFSICASFLFISYNNIILDVICEAPRVRKKLPCPADYISCFQKFTVFCRLKIRPYNLNNRLVLMKIS